MQRDITGKIANVGLYIACIAMVMYHMIVTQWAFLSALAHQNVHLAFALVIVFLSTFANSKSKAYRIFIFIMLILGIFVTSYVYIMYENLEIRVGFPTKIDFIVGIILIIVVWEATRQSFGIIIPLISLLAIAYFFLGHHLTGPFSHGYFSPESVISWLGIGLSGIYGMVLGVSANMIFLFVVFGGVIMSLGVQNLIFELGKAISKYSKAAAGQMAVGNSALVGMFSGAAIADVALVGSYTIPYMKKFNYRPVLACAIPASASLGAQMLPPVMGETAFLLAVFVGVNYVEVMIAGIVPAIIYYLALMTTVELQIRKENPAPIGEDIKADKKVILKLLPIFIVPIVTIILLLELRYTPAYAAFWAIIAALVVGYIVKESRPPLSKLIDGFVGGAKVGASIGVCLALIGTVSQSLNTTGLGIKLTYMVEALSGGFLPFALILIMLICIIIGMGMPTPAAYILVAIIGAPTLMKMGVPELSAHFFVWYWAILSALTPPVALAAMTAARIGGENFWLVSLESCKLAVVAYVLPFFIVYNPILLADYSYPVQTIILTYLSLIVFIFTASTSFTGFLFKRFSLIHRFFTFMSSICSAYAIMSMNFQFLLLGILIFMPTLFTQVTFLKRNKLPA